MRKRLLLAVAGALLLGVMAFVVSWRIWGQDELHADGPLVVQDADWLSLGSSGLDAAIVGELNVDRTCVRLGDDPVLWPEGTEWVAAERGVRLPDSRVAHDGDVIAGGGGFFGGEEDAGFEDSELAHLLSSCRSPGHEVAIFNQTEGLDLERAG